MGLEKTGPMQSYHAILTKNLLCAQVPEKATPFLSVSEVPITFGLLVALTASPNSQVLP